jgi:N5-(carboxyethyl)ornithine synthase
VGASRKENESRVAIHPQHLAAIPEVLRANLVFEEGYGTKFGVGDERLKGLGVALASRAEILGSSDVVILPKPMIEDLGEMKTGGILWGWPHCVQQRDITDTAIDRRLTLIAFEAMYLWGRDGDRQMHTFYKNNELAGYCGVLHALELVGKDGFYGPPRRTAVLGFGSVSRGAIYALQGRGFSDISIYTQRPPHLVRDQLFGCRHRHMRRPAGPDGPMTTVTEDGNEAALAEELASADLLVNGTLQDTDTPLMFLHQGDEEHLCPDSLIIDVSCDLRMGFPFARPTTFAEPIFQVAGQAGAVYYAVDHTPTYLWDSASWEISLALLPYLEAVMSGPEAWEDDTTIARAIEIQEGVIQNPKILSFQRRAAEYPHPILQKAGRSDLRVNPA